MKAKTIPEEVKQAAKVFAEWRKKKLSGYITCVGCGKRVFATYAHRRMWCSKRCRMRFYMREYNKKKRLQGGDPTALLLDTSTILRGGDYR